MKLIRAILIGLVLIGTAISFGGYKCPECDCSLIWTGRTDFCVGIQCRTVKYYRCACCNKIWKVYE